ncbi:MULTISPECIES: threonine aldolase family protein [unclassified Methylobacterium]|uniref:threonine aldolase family protein n=1 Tax=unclassified Methylobacterium TaxID=2615210 RepID=UPI000700EBCA|nr:MULTISPECIES: threonine aldolase family protein [unclassified Methylobacterium]KQO60464.1 threonine aldolase [Methylobacterium sp. Leaf86]KQP00205.1 threonine aldolase [Methylobacterium sp. Leaf91]
MIDLYSDTQTRPTPGMRDAMARAEVGDEQSDSDPTTLALCERVADLLGMEAGVFMPSGTMCNLVSILVQTRPGDEIVVDDQSHIYNTEAAGSAAIGGVSVKALATPAGIYTPEAFEAAIRPPARTAPRSALVSVEQTTSFSGGSVWPLTDMRRIRDLADRKGMKAHIDGARLLNAVAATDISARDYAKGFDSAWIDLSKGLGCPVGAVLCGSSHFIVEAWRWKYRLGGAMRQSGILAAAGLYALDHHVDQLELDNANAGELKARIAGAPGLAIPPDAAQSNILCFSVEPLGITATAFAEACLAEGIRIRAIGQHQIRATTHLDVDRAGILEAAEVIQAQAERFHGERR